MFKTENKRKKMLQILLLMCVYLLVWFQNLQMVHADDTEERIESVPECTIMGSELTGETSPPQEEENHYVPPALPSNPSEQKANQSSNQSSNTNSNVNAKKDSQVNAKSSVNTKSDTNSNKNTNSDESDTASKSDKNSNSKSTTSESTTSESINSASVNSASVNSVSVNSASINSISADSISQNPVSENSTMNPGFNQNTDAEGKVSTASVQYSNETNLSQPEQSKPNSDITIHEKNKSIERKNSVKEGSFLLTGSTVIYVLAFLFGIFMCKSKGGKMKKMKSVLKKLMGAVNGVLLVSILSGVIFTPVHAAEVSNTTFGGNEVAVSEMTDVSNTTEEVAQEEETLYEETLYDVDPLTVEEARLNHILCNTEWSDINIWLNCLSEEVRNELLKRNTILIQPTTVTEYEVDAEGEMREKGETKTQLFYEYAMSVQPPKQRVFFAHKSGYYQYQFVKQNQVCTFTVKLSGIDTTKDTSEQQTVTVSISREGDNFVNFSSRAGNYNTTDGYETVKLRRAIGATTGGYYNTYFGFTFTKPKGYAGSVNYVNAPTGRGDLFFYDQGDYDKNKRTYSDSDYQNDVYESVIACTNILQNTTVGSSNGAGRAMIYQIVLTPATFTTYYNGNGATGGSVGNQSCIYDNNYTIPSNGYTRQYTVTYNGNGGASEQANSTAVYQFEGWGFGNNKSVTHHPGQVYSNYTTVPNGSGTFYAIWKPASVVLPSATRTGYTFKGWNTNSGAQSGLAAKTAYTPTAGTILYATWAPNNYVIKFFDGIAKEAKGMQEMTFGVSKALTTASAMKITRTGYIFKGWKASTGGNYTDGQTVLNLTSEKGASINMIAEWEAAKDTSYTVEHYVQKEGGSYELKETQQLQGETDTLITPESKTYEGYEKPDHQTVKIEADGSTVVKYYYKSAKKENTNGNTDGGNGNAGGNMAGNNSGSNNGNMAGNNSGSNNGNMNGNTGGNNNGNNNNNGNAGSTGNEAGNGGDAKGSGAKPGEVHYYTDGNGNCYEFVFNEDKTLTIRAVTGQGAETVTIGSSLTVDNVKYQITEIAPYAFKNNKTIKKVTIGASITKIGKGAFEGCTNLRTVKLGNGLSEIGARAFYGCKSLTTVKTNKNLVKIGSKAFYNCKKLKSYTIGKYVKTIDSYAFYKCSALKKITISESVETIGKQAFYGCSKLKKVSIKSTKLLKIGSKAFKKCNKAIKFTVPAKKKKEYTKLLKGKM